VVAKYRIWRNR